VSRALGNSPPPVTWRDYQDYVSHARHEYLAAVQAARQRREATAGPAFEEFAAAERAAWFAYHETGHRAWLAYQETQRTQPPEPFPAPRDVSPYPMSDESALSVGLPLRHEPDVQAVWAALEARYGLNCPECGIPWRQPSPACPHLIHDVHPPQPSFTPVPEGMSVREFDDRWQPRRASDSNPESER
jgi:hypothetical protein